uniref:Uncharacterized protein n=1 Tax=Fusarium oxysporum f. sp. physali TaxID=2212625 RepID=A0A7U0Q6K0_FUSOX|nr:hypothetical protein [Fusarium oxysporum f. sp. physali]QQY97461.1 hypothetical protein [Fusarium oxysporum f. sp. physali]QQY97493.1 hypothetical protein [Fusarium oxysporum f. sp. physali]
MKLSYASVIMAAVSPVAAAVDCKEAAKPPSFVGFEGGDNSIFNGKYDQHDNDFWYSRPKDLATKAGVLRIANISDHRRIVCVASE